MLITRLLNKLIQDVQQTKKSYYTQVERACNSALQDIRSVDTDADNEQKVLRQKSLEYEQSEDSHNVGSSDNLDLLVGEEVRPQTSVDSEKFFIPFELACKGDVAKITITALDGIQALLTIVTSEQVQVHESTLLLILRTCCIIHLTTKSIVNQRTARAMLTQMLHSIFHRMEITAEELELQLKDGANRNETCASADNIDDDEYSDFQDWEAECIALVRECLSQSILFVSYDFNHIMTRAKNIQSFPSESSRDINQNSENFHEKIDENETGGNVVVANNEQHDSIRSSLQASSQEQDQVAQEPESSKLPEDALNPFLNSKSVCFSTTNNLINVLQKDAFLSFWTLTKLAVKPLTKPPPEGENDKNAADNKFQQAILAFHLLKEVLEKSGRVFKDSRIFSNAMRQHLYHALKENGISANAEIFKLEIETLMILLTKFNDIMVEEIQDLLYILIFPVEDIISPHQAEYSKIVLQSLNKISSNLDCFIHFYTSYDYNAEINARPFQKLVSTLCKIIHDKVGIEQQLAVEIVTNLLQSMSAACPKLEDSHDETHKLQKWSSFDEHAEDSAMKSMEIEGKDFLTCLHIFLASIELPCDVLKLDWNVQKMAQKMMDTSSVNSFRTETADCWYALIYACMSLIADIKITDCQVR